jgi:hypothetical protein
VDTNRADQLETIFGPGEYENTRPIDCLKSAQRKFQVFHVSIEKGGYDLSGWDRNLGNNHIRVPARDIRHLTEVVLATIRIANGADMHEVIASSKNASVLRHAFKNALKG